MKWYGKVGFIETFEKEDRPGVWVRNVTEREYTGDLIRNSSKWSQINEGTNDNINFNNQISVLSDPYLFNSIQSIRYIEFMGTFWDVTGIDVQYPRLIISMGGVYNGERTATPEGT